MKDLGFQIEIETNLKEVNFLDVTFNLNSSLYKPYKKHTTHHYLFPSSTCHSPEENVLVVQVASGIHWEKI